MPVDPYEYQRAEAHIEESEGDILVPQDWVVDGWDTEDENDPDETDDFEPEERKEGQAEKLERLHRQRQKFLIGRVGFYASSPGEISHAYALSSTDRVGGAAKYLATITQHQAYAVREDGEPIDTTDPEAAARSIAREFGNYASSARAEAHGLLELRAAIASREDLSKDAPIIEVMPLKDWKVQDWYRRSLTDLLRYNEAIALAQGTGEDRSGDKYSSSEPDVQQRLDVLISALTVGQALQQITERHPQQVERFSFWVQNLEKAYQHATGRLKAVLAKELSRVGRGPEEQ